MKRAVILFSVLATGCAGSGTRPARPDTTAADVLWLPINAAIEPDATLPVIYKNGRSIYIDDTGAVVFSFSGERDDLSGQIVRHFAASEWRQRSQQFANPQTSTSFDEGWKKQCACLNLTGERNPQPFHQWHGEWENARGDLITYHIGGIGQSLRGDASYLPVRVVLEILDRRHVDD